MFIVFAGPPGAGKGTQARRLIEYLSIPHLSTGDILRQAKQADSMIGRMAASYMDHGRLVPDRIIVELVRLRLQNPDCYAGCLFDGYPRTLEQARALDEELAKRSSGVSAAIELRVDVEELTRRMLERAKIEQRADDTPETIRERMRVYHRQTKPILNYYELHGLLDVVDGMGSPEEVARQIRECVDRRRDRAS